MAPKGCYGPPIADFALFAALWELIVGVGVCGRRTRRMSAIAGTATNLGLIVVAFIAAARDLPWEGCGCVFVGIEFPWLPGHAILAGVLALPFMAIVARSELRLRQSGEPPPNKPLQPTSGGHARGGCGSLGRAARG
ncbi:MAG TPA: hypothetical protein VFY93_00595 [Planctomycetota bacterium]|nr:hypothetical protein [Planctomycetota bacterium]